jgi:hypothetical protein
MGAGRDQILCGSLGNSCEDASGPGCEDCEPDGGSAVAHTADDGKREGMAASKGLHGVSPEASNVGGGRVMFDEAWERILGRPAYNSAATRDAATRMRCRYSVGRWAPKA